MHQQAPSVAHPINVHHFGPHPDYVGGMGSVIRVLTQHKVGAASVDCHATWHPTSIVSTTRLTISAIMTVVRLSRDSIVHVHLSEGGSFIREGMLVHLAHKRGLVTVVTLHGASFLS